MLRVNVKMLSKHCNHIFNGHLWKLTWLKNLPLDKCFPRPDDKSFSWLPSSRTHCSVWRLVLCTSGILRCVKPVLARWKVLSKLWPVAPPQGSQGCISPVPPALPGTSLPTSSTSPKVSCTDLLLQQFLCSGTFCITCNLCNTMRHWRRQDVRSQPRQEACCCLFLGLLFLLLLVYLFSSPHPWSTVAWQWHSWPDKRSITSLIFGGQWLLNDLPHEFLCFLQ